jgi:predicted nucleic acid-binding protein
VIRRAVLDAAAFDVIDTPDGVGLRALLRRLAQRGGEVCCAAVTLAEVCRGPARTRRVEGALVRAGGARRVQVVATDERLAKLVGAILHTTNSASDRLADAHVVAVCAAVESAIVITSDPDDMRVLAAAIPGTRIVSRDPVTPLGDV